VPRARRIENLFCDAEAEGLGIAEGILVGADEVPALVQTEGNKDGIPGDELGALGIAV